MTTKLRKPYARPLDFKHGRVEMSHGSGGRAASQLVEEAFVKAFANPVLARLDDNAVVPAPGGRLVITTDSHVVWPLFFPGGDIGTLSINGTINDLAMSGGTPLYLTAGFILEEGFPLGDLRRIVASMAEASRLAGVPVVAGDTKVVEKGKGDGVFINTTGVGVVHDGVNISGANARPGDCIVVSGPIGDHGVAVMSQRENLAFDVPVVSDTAPLHRLVQAMVTATPGLHCLRDATRGGLGTVLNEIARQSQVGMFIDESAVPVREGVRAACEFLGLDPLYVACEGRLAAVCDAGDTDRLLAAMRAHPLGRESALIGRVREDEHGFVEMQTVFGGRRVVDWLSGEQLPRIC